MNRGGERSLARTSVEGVLGGLVFEGEELFAVMATLKN